jgi:hypothetical protein
VFLMLVHFACALLGGVLALRFGSSSGGFLEVVGMVSVFYAYALLFLALPVGVAAFFGAGDRARFRLRIWTVVIGVVVLLGPSLLGLLFGITDWMEMRHPLNPVWTMDHLMRSSQPEGVTIGLIVLTIGVTTALVLNTKRMWSGVSEVLAASRARRGREELARS